jgi:hypothetical protein
LVGLPDSTRLGWLTRTAVVHGRLLVTEHEMQATGISTASTSRVNLSLTACGVQACGHPTGSPSNPSQSEYYN